MNQSDNEDIPENKLWIGSASSEDIDESRSINIDNTIYKDNLRKFYYQEII